jgi:nucleotide-binding universal stress UspA family protein
MVYAKFSVARAAVEVFSRSPVRARCRRLAALLLMQRGMDGNLLVATDFTHYSHDAVERVARLPLQPGTRVTLLHVVPMGLDASVTARLERAARAMMAGATATLEAELARTGRSRIAHQAMVAVGRPAEMIAQSALELRAGLVVIGRGKRHGFGERLLGSTAEQVVRSCPADVLLITRTRSAPYRRPFVAVDLSEVSRNVLTAAVRLCEPAHELIAMHAFDVPYAVMLTEGGMPANEVADFVSDGERKARAALDSWTRAASELVPKVQSLLIAGDPRESIPATAVANGADLIAIGSHRHSRIAGLLTGSVSEWIARIAPRDLLVVR